MKILKDILNKIDIKKIYNYDSYKLISQICIHSSEIIQDSIFVALSGSIIDGHFFIQEAIEKGSIVIICQKFPKKYYKKITYIQVIDCAKTLGLISANFYDHPSKKLRLIGITGTNGKTTTVSLLHDLFLKLGKKSSLISTICLKIGYQIFQTTHTMPNAIFIQKFLNKSVKKGCNYCFMEISSHGIHQKRHVGLFFFGGIFSNITHEHLDYHKTFSNYLYTKKKFFDELPSNSFSLINSDDKNSKIVIQNSKSRKYTYGFKNLSNFQGKILEKNILGMLLKFDKYEFWSQLTGNFNAYNLLAIYSSAVLIGVKKKKIIKMLSVLKPIKGRFENFISPLGINIIVDYAHTPDAIEKVLKTLQEFKKKNQYILCVLGCGGDRDKKKRPYMTKIACKNSDKVILTSDNPRNENPEKIIDEMEKNLLLKYKKKILRILERKLAIKKAIELAKPKDIILIAGKGHENYQDIKGIHYPFDDMKIAKKIICIKEKFKLKK